MKISAIVGVIWLVLAATAVGQSKSVGNAPSSGVSSKASLAEVRAIIHELEGRTDKLRELLSQHRAHVERRPQSEEQLAKWDAALERLLLRIDGARAEVVEATQRLDKSIKGELPTGLAKDVARVRNDAEPERATAEQVLAKNKPSARKAKPAKQAASEKSPPPSNEDLDL
jgi:DNA repair exonuclease SbcCD ATPase subunit